MKKGMQKTGMPFKKTQLKCLTNTFISDFFLSKV